MSIDPQNERYNFFWKTMERCDWDFEGNDDKVLAPVITYLAEQGDEAIFQFDNLMSELLYHLDTRELAEQYKNVSGFTSGDGFLYSRCVALINGPEYYKKAENGKQKNM